jgi:hypothetical protein
MRALLMAGLAALGLAACSASEPVSTGYAPAAYVSAPVRASALAYAAEPAVLAPSPVIYRAAAVQMMAEPDAYPYEAGPEAYEPAMPESDGDYGGVSGGCSELVVC